MKKDKIVISDVDGTLFNSDKQIPEKSIEVIKSVRNDNIEFTIATGRLYYVVQDIIETLNITKPLILCNGAIIQDPKTQEILYSKALDNKVVYDMISLVDKMDVHYYYYTMDSINSKELKYTSLGYKNLNEKMKYEKKLKINISSNLLEKCKGEDVYKLIIMEKDMEKLSAIREKLTQFEKYTQITSSNWDNIEIVAKGCSKASGVQFFAEKMGYDIENIMCIGDEDNDKSMLEIAGFSVAMGNGNEDIKKIVDFVTDDNDSEGMSKAILEFAKR